MAPPRGRGRAGSSSGGGEGTASNQQQQQQNNGAGAEGKTTTTPSLLPTPATAAAALSSSSSTFSSPSPPSSNSSSSSSAAAQRGGAVDHRRSAKPFVAASVAGRSTSAFCAHGGLGNSPRPQPRRSRSHRGGGGRIHVDMHHQEQSPKQQSRGRGRAETTTPLLYQPVRRGGAPQHRVNLNPSQWWPGNIITTSSHPQQPRSFGQDQPTYSAASLEEALEKRPNFDSGISLRRSYPSPEDHHNHCSATTNVGSTSGRGRSSAGKRPVYQKPKKRDYPKRQPVPKTTKENLLIKLRVTRKFCPFFQESLVQKLLADFNYNEKAVTSNLELRLKSVQPKKRNLSTQPPSKLYFERHLDDVAMNRGLKNGSLVVGSLRINKKRPVDAYATVEGFPRDVYIEGHYERNRAMDSDVVLIRLEPVQSWKIKQTSDEVEKLLEVSVLEDDEDDILPDDSILVDEVSDATNELQEEGDSLADHKETESVDECFDEHFSDGCDAEIPDDTVANIEEEILADVETNGVGEKVDGAEDNTAELEVSALSVEDARLHSGGKELLPPVEHVDETEASKEELVETREKELTENEDVRSEFVPHETVDEVPAEEVVETREKRTPANENSNGGKRISRENGGNIFEKMGMVCVLSDLELGELVMKLREKDPEVIILQPRGMVVKILRSGSSSEHSGFIEPSKGKFFNKSDKFAQFRPLNRVSPFAIVSVREIRGDPALLQNVMVSVKYLPWLAHQRRPFARFVDIIGECGTVEADTKAILINNDVPNAEEFSSEVLSCLPTVPWTIPDEEISSRKDLRCTRIFSIDPVTAKDLDDALSIQLLESGNYEVGIHIADVSHFVLPNSALDKEALNRATTVYMVHKAFPMLPAVLCEDLCSLNPSQDRLAFSVIFELTAEGKIVNEWFGKTVIRSCSKISYDLAQLMIENTLQSSWSEVPESHQHLAVPDVVGPFNGFSVNDIAKDVCNLHSLATTLRKKRVEKGSLFLGTPKLYFDLDEQNLPRSTSIHELKESNHLVEEFMLLANKRVARKISSYHPSGSLLRRHEPPNPRMLDEFALLCNKNKWGELDVSNAISFGRSLKSIKENVQNMPYIEDLIQLFAVKPMNLAKYFCTGSHPPTAWVHYALGFSHYTHFTSPIRRYADVIVHRTLHLCLCLDSFKAETVKNRNEISRVKNLLPKIKDVDEICEKCNIRKLNATKAEDSSTRSFLCIMLKRSSVTTRGVVLSVGKKYLVVFIPLYGFDGRIFLEDDRSIVEFKYSKSSETVLVEWAEDSDSVHPVKPHSVSGRDKSDSIALTINGKDMQCSIDRKPKEKVVENLRTTFRQEIGKFSVVDVVVGVKPFSRPLDTSITLINPVSLEGDGSR